MQQWWGRPSFFVACQPDRARQATKDDHLPHAHAVVEIQPIRVEIELEDDGRILASVPDLPGVMAYGATADEAVCKIKSIALQVLADMIESGLDVPEPL